jgi:hypothetical protein
MSTSSETHEVGPSSGRGAHAGLTVADLRVEVGRGGERVLVVEDLDRASG